MNLRHRWIFVTVLLVLALATAGCAAPAAAPAAPEAGGEPAAESLVPITILINDSPWFAGFEALVNKYVEDTGNEVILNVTPFNGMLEKSRNAVQADQSEFDILNLNEQWYVQFYEGGLVTPIKEIDPDFELDPNVIEYDYCHALGSGDRLFRPQRRDLRAAHQRQHPALLLPHRPL